MWVALRKESVDRNREQFKYVVQCRKSLSARRAWIEIVDEVLTNDEQTSLSARRAWIEIVALKGQAKHCQCRSPQGERG